MPPVDEIRKLNVDPYTIRVESDDPDQEDLEEFKEETVATKKPLAWKIRKPERQIQGNLKTGYEPIIRQRKNKRYGAADDSDDDDDGKRSRTEIKKRKSLSMSIVEEDQADVAGYGVNPYEGKDIITHLKNKVAE